MGFFRRIDTKMPLHLRKSVSAGPFRFNFSKSGVGLSLGVRGLRIGSGPRGHYIQAGRGGIYYRSSLAKTGRRGSTLSNSPEYRSPIATPRIHYSDAEMIEIESGDVIEMRNETFSELLDELNEKQKRPRLSRLLSIFCIVLALTSLLVFDSIGFLAFLAIPISWAIGRWLDSYLRVVVLFYDLDSSVHDGYSRVTSAFDMLNESASKWHHESQGEINSFAGRKRHAGASYLVKRKKISLEYRLPIVTKCNVTPPSIPAGKQTLYFFPDVLLVEERGQFGAIGYDDLQIDIHDSRFIEENKIPRDAEIVDYSWRYPNKNGGPDKRFKNNYEIPVASTKT